MPLTDLFIRSLKHSTKSVKHYDAGGLYLEVAPSGRPRWRLKYRFAGKEKRLSLGVYPDVSLKEARNRRDEARKLISRGIDPSEQRKAQRAASDSTNSLEVLAHEWLSNQSAVWSAIHRKNILQRLENDVFPYIGKAPINELTPPELLKVLRRIEAREANETAHRVRGNLGQIFRYAIATGRATHDPSRDLRGALKPVDKKHLAAVTDPELVAPLLRTMDGYKGSFIVSSALKFAPLVFVRPLELRTAKWEDIDLDGAEWRYFITKTKTDHIVPLATQAVEILREIFNLTGKSPYVFPSPRSFARPMSNNAILAAMRNLDIPKDEMCGHGFRAMARTILDEVLGFPPHIIEHQMAHNVKDALGRAYNRTKHLKERKEMMQKWADYLDELKRKPPQ